MTEPWDGKDLILLVSMLISCTLALYFGLDWAQERARDKRIKRLQKEWADRNEARRRELEESDDDWATKTWRPTDKN